MPRSKIHFEWNYSHSTIIKYKGLQNKDFYKEVAQIMYRHMYKYVPWDSTQPFNKTDPEPHLAEHVRISATDKAGYVTFLNSYANYQYEWPGRHDTNYHPLATSAWDQACWNQEKIQIGREVSKARKKYCKK